MLISLQDMVQNRLRSILMEGSPEIAAPSTGYLAPRNLVLTINRAYEAMLQEMRRAARPEVLMYLNADVENPDTGLLNRVLPIDRMAEVVCVTSRYHDTPTVEEETLVAHYVFAGRGASTRLSTYKYRQYDYNRLYVMGRPAGTNRFRVWMTRQMPSLHCAACPSNGTTSTFALNPSPLYNANFTRQAAQYVGTPVYFYSGPAAGELAVISSVNSSTWVATLAPAHGAPDDTPLTVAPTTSTLYSLLPVFPPNHFEHLMYRAAAMLTRFSEASVVAQEAAKTGQHWLQWLTPQDKSSPRPVVRALHTDLGMRDWTCGGWWGDAQWG
jgi:hypothetical protein